MPVCCRTYAHGVSVLYVRTAAEGRTFTVRPGGTLTVGRCLLKNEDGLLLVDGPPDSTYINDQPVSAPTHAFPGDQLRVDDAELSVEGPGEDGETLAGDGMLAVPAPSTGDTTWPGTDEADTRPAPKLPERIADRYRVERLLGEGGMGRVLAARDEQADDRPVAVKLLTVGLTTPKMLERFRREGEIGSKLGDHAGVVQVTDSGVDGATDEPYLVMDLIDGSPLSLHIPPEGLEDRPAAETIFELAKIVGYAHSQGVVHRDLKPDNVLVANDGSLHVTDFGLARELSETDRLTRTGVIMGTPLFMAPEQVLDSKTASMPADVYALGVIFYALLTGDAPHRGERAHELFREILAGQIEPPSSRRAGVDPDLEAICLKALSRYALDRYPHAAALARALHEWLQAHT